MCKLPAHTILLANLGLRINLVGFCFVVCFYYCCHCDISNYTVVLCCACEPHIATRTDSVQNCTDEETESQTRRVECSEVGTAAKRWLQMVVFSLTMQISQVCLTEELSC